MALGTLTIVERANSTGPAFHMRCTIVGDGAYGSGGSTGLLAALRTAMGDDFVNIISCKGASPPATVAELEYDHANEKLFARVRTTGVESAVSDQSSVTYGLDIVAA